MANHASAAKRNRQRIKREARNKSIRSSLRTALKQARLAIQSGEVDAAKEKVAGASRALARAVTQGVLHRNNASRTTSRIQSQLAKIAK